jgi:hypothetical protein
MNGEERRATTALERGWADGTNKKRNREEKYTKLL